MIGGGRLGDRETKRPCEGADEKTNRRSDKTMRSVQSGWAARRSFDKLSMTLRVETKRPRDRETKRGGVRNDKTTSGRADKRTKRRADKQTNDRTDKRHAGENGSGGYRTENRVAMGGGENFVDKSLLFGLNLLSLQYTMQLTRTK